MDKALNRLCNELNNFFPRQKIGGKFTIQNNTIELPFLQSGQYYRIVGSVFNDGVHQYPSSDLKDEIFTGYIWSMAVPEAVIDLASEVDNWITKYAGTDSPNMSPYSSESFNNYSYSKDSGVSEDGSANNTWQTVFSGSLKPYRRLRGI